MLRRAHAYHVCCVLLLLLSAVVPAGAEDPAEGSRDYVPGEILVKFTGGVTTQERQRARSRVGAVKVRGFRGGIEQLRLTSMSVERALHLYRDDPSVAFAEPNFYLSIDIAPDDPRFNELWGLENTGQTGGVPGADIDVTSAWAVTTGSRDVVVAVIDSGIKYSTHADLIGNIWVNPGEIPGNGIDDDGNGYVDDVNGWDFANDDAFPFDDNGHGTHVAGTIGAIGDNAFGVTGVNWKVSLMPLKFLFASGIGTTSDAIEAIDYATAMGVDVINASWGGGGFSQSLLESIERAGRAEILFVASAGNEGTDNDALPHYPSSYEATNVIAVAATDHSDALANFSNVGSTSVDLAAPGVNILSTVRTSQVFGLSSGTSMAVPHVVGVAALIRSVAPNIRAADLRQVIFDCVDPIPVLAGVTATGGRLNAFCPIQNQDTTPPGAVGDLQATETTSNTIFLTWTATGDDGSDGRASLYEVRYSTNPIDALNFNQATPAVAPPAPQEAGLTETMELGSLDADTSYYVALRVRDEWDNAGPVSNVVTGTTLLPPTAATSPASFNLTIDFGTVTVETITIQNIGDGTLDWSFRNTILTSADGLTTISPIIASSTEGRLQAGTGQQVDLSFSAVGLVPGAYAGMLTMDTNDPQQLVLNHTVTMTIVSVPAIEVGIPLSVESTVEFFVDGARTDHTLAITIAPTGAASIEVVADGDFGFAAETAEVSAEGTVLGTVGGASGVDCVPQSATFPLDGQQLADLIEDDLLEVSVQNTSSVNVFCTDNLHIVRLVYLTQTQLLDFGTLFIGASKTRVIRVANAGSADLNVTSITSDAIEFAPSLNSIVLAPGESEDIEIVFTSITAGPVAATLTIASDDPEDPIIAITLSGTAELAPMLTVSPSSIAASAYVRGSATHVVTLTNGGGSDLGFTLQIVSEEPFVYSVIPFSGTIPPGGSVDLEVVLGYRQVEVGVHTGTLDILTNDPLSPRTSVPISLTVLDAPDLKVYGSIVAIQTSVDFDTSNATTEHPMTIPEPPVSDGTMRIDYEGDFGSSNEFGFVTIDGFFLHLFGQNALDCVPQSDTFEIPLLFLDVYGSDGVIDFGVDNSSSVGAFCPRNNHSLRLEYPTEVEPRDFGTVFIDSYPELSFVIVNDGTTPLSVTSISSDAPVFVLSHSSLTLAPGQSQQIDMIFAPPTTGTYSGTLTVASDDPDGPVATVTLLGTALDPPILSYTPTLFSVSLPVGVQHVETLTLTNSGTNPLAYSLAVSPPDSTLVGFGNASGSVGPGATEFIDILLSTTGLTAGTNQAQIILTTNDPAATQIPILVTVSTTGAPDILVQTPPILVTGSADFSFSVALTNIALPLVVPPEGGGSLRLTATGDFRFSHETATLTVEGDVLGSAGNSGVFCGSAVATFELSAGQLATFATDGVLDAQIQNSNSVTAFCTSNNHHLELSYRAHLTGVDFGTSFVGSRSEQTIDIINAGTDALTISTISTDLVEFQASETSLVIPAGGFHSLVISFEPSVTGNFSGSLSIASDDPDTPSVVVPLMGIAEAAPEILVTPGLIAATLPVGASEVRTVTIQNPGGNPLEFSIGVQTLTSGGDFVTVQPANGSITAGSSQQIEVVLDTAPLLGGTHQALIDIASNDPATPVLTVPVDLLAIGIPDIAIGGDEQFVRSFMTYFGSGQRTVHPFEITGPVVGDATVDLVVNGDYRYDYETATISLDGVTLGSVGNTGFSCFPARGRFTLPAMVLAAAVLDGEVELEVQNSPQVGWSNGCNSHTVEMSYRQPITGLDFGTVQVGQYVEREFLIRNNGTDTLDVSALVPDVAEFSVSPTSVTIPARSGVLVTVVLVPTVAGLVSGNLTIQSNDADAPDVGIALTATVLDPPAVAVSGSGLTLSLANGQQSQGGLSVSNLGGAVLEFVAKPHQPSQGAGIRYEALATTPRKLSCIVPDPVAGVIYAHARGKLFYRYSVADDVWERLVDSPIGAPPHCDMTLHDGSIYVSYNGQTNYFAVYSLTGEYWSVIPDPTGIGFSRIASNGDRYVYIQNGLSLDRFEPKTGALVPLAAAPLFPRGALLYFEGALYAHEYETFVRYDVASDTWETLATAPGRLVQGAAIDPVSREYVVYGAEDERNLYRYSIDTGELVQSTIPLFTVSDGGLAWVPSPTPGIYFVQGENGVGFGRMTIGSPYITITPPSGSIDGGQVIDADVLFDSSGLGAGVYSADILVATNDSQNPLIALPTQLTVASAPDIRLRGESVPLLSSRDFFFSGSYTSHVFGVPSESVSDATLEITVTGRFGHPNRRAYVDFGGVRLGWVGYPPASSSCMAWTEVFEIPKAMVNRLTATGVVGLAIGNSSVPASCPTNNHKARLTLAPLLETLDFAEVFEGVSTTRQFAIENRGDDTLEITSMAAPEPQFTTTPQTASILPGETLTVTVNFLSTGNATYDTILSVHSNDPDTPIATVPLRAVGVDRPVIDVQPVSLQSTLSTNDRQTQTLTLRNLGGSDLSFTAKSLPAGVASGSIGADPVGGPSPDAGAASSPSLICCLTGDPLAGSVYAVSWSLNNFYRFNATTNSWASLADVPFQTQRGGGSAFLNDKVYTTFIDNPTNLFVYDTQTAMWSTILHPLGRAASAIASDGERYLYLAANLELVRYDTVDGTTTALTPGIYLESTGTMRYLDGRLYVYAGYPRTNFAVYDVTADSWQSLPSVPRPSNQGSAIDPYNRAFFVQKFLDDLIYRFDIEGGFWSAIHVGPPSVDGGLQWVLEPAPRLYWSRGLFSTQFGYESTPIMGLGAITVTPTTGVIPPGGALGVDVLFDATGLGTIGIAAQVLVISNDPVHPEVSIPLQFDVTGAPDIRVGSERTQTSLVTYTFSGATTVHDLQLSEPPIGDVTVEVTVLGDFSSSFEFATLFAEGEEIGVINGGFVDCVPATESFVLSEETFQRLAADGVLQFEVQNSFSVGNHFGCTDSHTVSLRYLVAADPIDFGDLFLGTPSQKTIVVENNGTEPLIVQSIQSDESEFTVSPSSFTVPVNGRQEVVVTFAPSVAGTFSGTLTIVSNDTDEGSVLVNLMGSAASPPVLSVNPGQIDVSLFERAIETRLLALQNSGGADLEFIAEVIDGTDFLTLQPTAGVVASGQTIALELTLDATGLSPGSHSGQVQIQSNDPANPIVIVPLNVTLAAAPHISVSTGEITLSSTLPFTGSGATTQHPFTVVVPPVGEGTLRLTVNGDYGSSSERANVFLEGVLVGTLGGAGSDCTPLEASFPIDADALAAAAQDGIIEIRVTDTFSVNAFCAVNTHSVELKYSAGSGNLDFGTVLVGNSATLNITVFNEGSLPLTVSSIGSDIPDMSAQPSSFSLNAGAVQAVALNFDPTVVGQYDALLNIASDDPDDPVFSLPLKAVARTPPVIGVNPPSLSSTVLEGRQDTQTLTISNTGGSALEFELTAYVIPPGAQLSSVVPDLGTLSAQETEGIAIDDVTAELHTAVFEQLADSPESLKCVVGDPLSGVIYAQSYRSERFYRYVAVSDRWERLADSPLTSSGTCGAAMLGTTVYTAHSGNGAFLGAYDTVSDTWSEVATPTGATANIASDGQASLYLLSGQELVRLDPATGAASTLTPVPSVVQFSTSGGLAHFEGRLIAHSGSFGYFGWYAEYDIATDAWIYFSFLPSDVFQGLTIDPESRDSVAYGPNGIVYLTSLDSRSIRFTINPLVVSTDHGGVAWLGGPVEAAYFVRGDGGTELSRMITGTPAVATAPGFGSVPVGGTVDVDILFDGSELAPKTYDIGLSVHSNDPATPVVEVPTTLTVVGAPDIHLPGELQSMTSTRDFESTTLTEHAFPVAGVPERVTVMVDAVGDFGHSSETARVFAEGSLLGVIESSGVDCQTASETFTLYADDLSVLAADGLIEFAVENSSGVFPFCPVNRHTIRLEYQLPLQQFDFGQVFLGTTDEKPLVIANSGSVALNVTSIATDLVGVTIPSAPVVVPPGGQVTIELGFTPPSLGTHAGTLSIVSDDPDNSQIDLPILATSVAPPVAQIAPPSIAAAIPPGSDLIKTKPLQLSNTGGSDLIWSADLVRLFPPGPPPGRWIPALKGDESGNGTGSPTIEQAGGPDAFGYHYRDSSDPEGPDFAWTDVAQIGTPLLLDGDDQNSGPISIGFAFPFYGEAFDTVNVSTNGWLSFTNGSSAYSNPDSLPDDGYPVPENLLAPFWDDLHLRGQQAIRYYREPGRFIVQYTGVDRFNSGSNLTFQVVLETNGRILFQYLQMSGDLNSATIGIQNGDRTAGLLASYNQSYIVDGLTIEFAPEPPWVTADLMSGVVSAGGQQQVLFQFDGPELVQGDYASEFVITTNDPFAETIVVPVVFHVQQVGLDIFEISANPKYENAQETVEAVLQPTPNFSAADILVDSVMLWGQIPAESSTVALEDRNGDGRPELIVQFDAMLFEQIAQQGEDVIATVTGEIRDQAWFSADDTLRILPPTILGLPGPMFIGQSANVSWSPSASPLPKTYDVMLSRDAGETWETVTTGVQTTQFTWTVTGPETPTALVRVYAFDDQGLLGFDTNEDPFSIFTLNPPGDVETLILDSDASDVILSWEPPAFGGSFGPAEEYRVLRADSAMGPFVEFSSTTTTQARDAHANHSGAAVWFFKVVPVNASGAGPE